MSAASYTIDGLENLATGQGGAKDSRAHGNRHFSFTPRTPIELEQLYRSNWLASQVVDIPAFEMTRARREFQIEDGGKTKEIAAVSKRLMYWEKVSEALQWSRLYGGGALLLGLDNTGELDEPLDLRRVKEGSLKFIHSLDSRTLVPNGGFDTQLVFDPTSPQFMQPEYYSIASARMDFVHHSRIVRFPGMPLPWLEMQRTLWWGGSYLERMFEPIADAEQVIGGIAQLVTEASVDVIGIPGLLQMVSTPEGEERVRKRMSISDTLKSLYNSIIHDTKEEYTQKQNALVQGMSPLIETYLVTVAAASGIPVTRLLGTSAKGLSATGEGDLRNFYDMIDAQRQNYLRTRIDRLDQVFMRSAIGEAPDEIEWEFGSLWQMDDAQAAEIDNKRANTAKIYVDMGAIDEVIVGKQLLEDGTYVGVDEDYVNDLESDFEEHKDDPPPMPPGIPANSQKHDPAGNVIPDPKVDPEDE